MGEDKFDMSQKDRDRLKLLHEANRGSITQKQASEELRVTERQTAGYWNGCGRMLVGRWVCATTPWLMSTLPVCGRRPPRPQALVSECPIALCCPRTLTSFPSVDASRGV